MSPLLPPPQGLQKDRAGGSQVSSGLWGGQKGKLHGRGGRGPENPPATRSCLGRWRFSLRAGVGGAWFQGLGDGLGNTAASFYLGSSDGHHWSDPGLRRPQPQGLQFQPAHQALPLLLPRGELYGHLLNLTFPLWGLRLAFALVPFTPKLPLHPLSPPGTSV